MSLIATHALILYISAKYECLTSPRNLQHSLEMMRDSIRETLSETRQIKHDTIEEEVLIRLAKIDKTCNSALRQARRAERLLRNTGQPTRIGH